MSSSTVVYHLSTMLVFISFLCVFFTAVNTSAVRHTESIGNMLATTHVHTPTHTHKHKHFCHRFISSFVCMQTFSVDSLQGFISETPDL